MMRAVTYPKCGETMILSTKRLATVPVCSAGDYGIFRMTWFFRTLILQTFEKIGKRGSVVFLKNFENSLTSDHISDP